MWHSILKHTFIFINMAFPSVSSAMSEKKMIKLQRGGLKIPH
jgi:hypothetical protein